MPASFIKCPIPVQDLPEALDEYLKQVVLPTLERQKAGGAVAEKFEMAYLRSFNVGDPPKAEAAKVYARWVRGGVPGNADYKKLQDFLFRYIAMECGRHGGWPYVREIGALLQKPNVYLDISSQDLIIPPHTEAKWIREWLEFGPQKVLFGTDGYPYTDYLDWPEATWIATRNARLALGVALTGMLRDHEISRARAYQIARMVLRGNAESLYKFKLPPGKPDP